MLRTQRMLMQGFLECRELGWAAERVQERKRAAQPTSQPHFELQHGGEQAPEQDDEADGGEVEAPVLLHAGVGARRQQGDSGPV